AAALAPFSVAWRGRELDRQQSLDLKLALEEQLAAGGGTSEGGGRGSSGDDGGMRAATGVVLRADRKEGRVTKEETRLEAAEAILAAEAVPALVASVEAKDATGQAIGGRGNSGGRIATPRQGIESRAPWRAESLSPTRRVILERERVAAAEAR
ncbi:unnamed protein product, partial [Ectocarpus sp. 12 AP-2014]